MKSQMNKNYISYSDICRVLKVDPQKPSYNPKNLEILFEHIEQIDSIIDDKKEAEEIVNLAQIGEFGLLRIMYQ
jgi:hypothetical protein